MEAHLQPGGGAADGGVEDMGAQMGAGGGRAGAGHAGGQTEARDAADLTQCSSALVRRVGGEAGGERAEDVLRGMPGDTDDEGKAEPVAIGAVQRG